MLRNCSVSVRSVSSSMLLILIRLAMNDVRRSPRVRLTRLLANTRIARRDLMHQALEILKDPTTRREFPLLLSAST